MIDTFLAKDILDAFVPFTDDSRYIMNSIDALSVTADHVELSGRCFARPAHWGSTLR